MTEENTAIEGTDIPSLTGHPDEVLEYQAPDAIAPNRKERRKMERAGKGAVKRWMREQRAKGNSLAEMNALLDYAETMPAMVAPTEGN